MIKESKTLGKTRIFEGYKGKLVWKSDNELLVKLSKVNLIMLRDLIAYVLNNYLGKYVENLNTTQLTVALLSGNLIHYIKFTRI